MSHFNSAANEWDTPEKIELAKTMANAVNQWVSLENVHHVLDFGCGTGLLSLAVIEKCFEDSNSGRSFKLTGIDTSSGMLEVFKKKSTDNVEILTKLVNLEEEGIDEKFDLILTSMAFHHLEKPGQMVSKLESMLNPGGQLVVIDLMTEDGTFHPDNRGMGVKHFGFSKEEMQQWCNQAGLSNFNYESFYEFKKNDRSYPLFVSSCKKS